MFTTYNKTQEVGHDLEVAKFAKKLSRGYKAETLGIYRKGSINRRLKLETKREAELHVRREHSLYVLK